MSKIQWKPGTMISPLPAVLVSAGTPEQPNAMTAAWTGIVNSSPPKTYVSIRPERYSHALIKESGVFVINLTTAAMATAVDYCGVRSGKHEDKLRKVSLTAESSFVVSAPSIAEAPVSLECRVFKILPLGSHDMFLADIVSVSVDDSLLSPGGRLSLEKAGMLLYSHGAYYRQGAFIGKFGFSVEKKKHRAARRKTI